MSRTAISLGLFDGVHLGHRAVLDTALRQAENGLSPMVFTFPAETAAQKGAGFLYPTDVRNALFAECGEFAGLHIPDFEDVRGLDGETFARELLAEQDGAAFVACGRDFRFGRGAAWGVDDLVRFGKAYGFTVEIVEDVTAAGGKVSSTRIRECLQSGEIRLANTLLGAPYRITREITHGAHLGHTIGFATINQSFAEGQLVPKFGVYASETLTPGGWRQSITNIGVKPTVGYAGGPLAETHILGYSGDLYGRELTVVLTDYIRGEQKFASLDALISQMHSDIETRRKLSDNYHVSNT